MYDVDGPLFVKLASIIQHLFLKFFNVLTFLYGWWYAAYTLRIMNFVLFCNAADEGSLFVAILKKIQVKLVTSI